MFFLKKAIVIILVLLVSGFALRPFDNSLRRDMEEHGLLYEPLDLDTREAIGQTSLAIALGGLRSLVASMTNLSASASWEVQDWFALEDKYNTIVALQPKTRYYWQSAAWHLGSNAWADYQDKPGLSPAQRRLRQNEVFVKAADFLQRGIANNPQDAKLRFDLAYLYENPHRKPNDLEASAEAYKSAIACENSHSLFERRLFYVLVRIPAQQQEAYTMSRKLLAHPKHSSIPSVRTQSWALQHRFAPEEERKSLEEVFDSRFSALENLSYYLKREKEGFPMYGVRETLRQLIEEFDIPEEHSPLRARGEDETPWSGFPDEIRRKYYK